MGKRCGNCANSTWLNGTDAVPEVCIECKYVHAEPSNWKEKIMTNADRIRAMSDEELAKVMLQLVDLDDRIRYCKDLPECQKALDDDVEIPADRCRSCLLSWLQQPAEVDNG